MSNRRPPFRDPSPPRMGDPSRPNRSPQPVLGMPGGSASMPGFQNPGSVMERGRDGQMVQRPQFPSNRVGQRLGGKGRFDGSPVGNRPQFGYGLPNMPGGPMTGMFSKFAQNSGNPLVTSTMSALGQVPATESPWIDSGSEWDDGQPQVDMGMGRTMDRRAPDRSWWEDRMNSIRGESNTVDPGMDWGDSDWMDTYEPGDFVQVKADGNPNFGKAWDGDSWEDSDPNDAANASMFAESKAWDEDYQTGIKEAWANNDERAFQRWRNLARANQTSQWQNQPAAAQPNEPTYSLPKKPSNPSKPKQPTTPTPPYQAPDPWKKKQGPIY